MSIVSELPPRIVCPLRREFESNDDIALACFVAHGGSGQLSREREYATTRHLAKHKLTRYLDQFTSAELATIAWADIADDVRALTYVSENP
jgi:oligoribonuclease (3'-5' exoribonuclease)